jgi:hypothetical protein
MYIVIRREIFEINQFTEYSNILHYINNLIESYYYDIDDIEDIGSIIRLYSNYYREELYIIGLTELEIKDLKLRYVK